MFVLFFFVQSFSLYNPAKSKHKGYTNSGLLFIERISLVSNLSFVEWVLRGSQISLSIVSGRNSKAKVSQNHFFGSWNIS